MELSLLHLAGTLLQSSLTDDFPADPPSRTEDHELPLCAAVFSFHSHRPSPADTHDPTPPPSLPTSARNAASMHDFGSIDGTGWKANIKKEIDRVVAFKAI